MQLTLMELLIKGVPESLLIVLAMYFICNKQVKLKQCVGISLIFLLAIYGIRLLPINVGFHTIITMFVIIIMSHIILEIEVFQATKAMIGITIMTLLCEGLNMLLLSLLLGDKLQSVLANTEVKYLYAIPSTAFLAIGILILYFRVKNRTIKNIKKVEDNGKISTTHGS